MNSLCDWNVEIYRETLGVIGLLSSWLRSALAEMTALDNDVLTWSHLDSTRNPNQDRANIRDEIVVGEEYLGVEGDSVLDLDPEPPSGPKGTRPGKRKRAFQANVERRASGGRS